MLSFIVLLDLFFCSLYVIGTSYEHKDMALDILLLPSLNILQILNIRVLANCRHWKFEHDRIWRREREILIYSEGMLSLPVFI
jgi:hypothetical protein